MLMISPVQVVNQINESEALHTLINPEIYALGLVRYGEFHLQKVRDEYENGWASISGVTEVDDEIMQTKILITAPGFIARAISRARGVEPQANVHLNMYLDECEVHNFGVMPEKVDVAAAELAGQSS